MPPLRGFVLCTLFRGYNPDSPSGFGLYKLSFGNFKNRELIIWQSEFGPKPRRIDMIIENPNTFSWKNHWGWYDYWKGKYILEAKTRRVDIIVEKEMHEQE